MQLKITALGRLAEAAIPDIWVHLPELSKACLHASMRVHAHTHTPLGDI